jgi:alginate O-acetyltransferase complex protein AlgI
MVFSSHLFLFYFLPAVLLMYYLLPHRGRNLFLTLASYLFYGWANPLFVILLLFSTLVDYVCGLVMACPAHPFGHGPVERLPPGAPRTPLQRTALMGSIASNLLLLGFFKYFNFGVDSYTALVDALGCPGLRLDFALRVTLPLGISFYTFQTMSYTLDVYRGHAKAICHFPDFACFVSMFPQLVAGPIIRFSDIADQIRRRDLSTEKFARGVAFFGMGLAKKILLANPCGKIADTVFNAASADVAHSWYGVTAYAFQIYFDFSGYSDMAIGLGLMLGFVFAKNFDSPYRSRSMTEFWKRWHISLSTWLRDYLYIPLGGNRRGPIRTYVNLGLVMLLGGLWHGAAWTFVIWGALHGTILCLERLRGKTSVYERLPGALQTGITFVVVLFTWVFFRSPDLPAALEYCGRMLGLGAAEPGTGLIAAVIFRPYYVLTFAVAAVVVWLGPQTWDWTRKLTLGKAVAILCLVWASVLALTTQTYNPFIYFIF